MKMAKENKYITKLMLNHLIKHKTNTEENKYYYNVIYNAYNVVYPIFDLIILFWIFLSSVSAN